MQYLYHNRHIRGVKHITTETSEGLSMQYLTETSEGLSMQYLYHNRHIRGVKHAVSLSQQTHQRGQAYHNRDIRGVKHAVSEGLSMQCPYHNREYRNPMQWPKKRSGASTQAKRGRNFRPKKQITIRGVKTTNKKQKAYITKIHAFILYEVHKIPLP